MEIKNLEVTDIVSYKNALIGISMVCFILLFIVISQDHPIEDGIANIRRDEASIVTCQQIESGAIARIQKNQITLAKK